MNPCIDRVDVHVCRIPTAQPESDGTAEWAATTIVLVFVRAAGVTGLGYSYVDAAAGAVVRDLLTDCVVDLDAMRTREALARMLVAVRNHGRPGLVACAISAVDLALWDLKARLLDVPLAVLIGPVTSSVPVYASGGFTSTHDEALAREVRGYREAGHRRIKIKVGRDPSEDYRRVEILREAAGPNIELMVDANGAYSRKQALAMADQFAALGVRYFEEPVSSDDLEGLRLLRDRAMQDIAAGEYGYDAFYFRRMLDAGAVDILQADATRCLGVTGFLHADALAYASSIPLSSHCAPALHVHLASASQRFAFLEYFRDHVRIENLLFEGAPEPRAGMLAWNPGLPGNGLQLRQPEMHRFEVR